MNKNRYRSENAPKQKIQLLEQALSLSERFFSKSAFRRGGRRLRHWGFILLLALPVLLAVGAGIYYGIDKAYSLSLDRVKYESRHHFISREQALDILGLKGSVNMATVRMQVLEMERKLNENPCIQSAHIRAELPDTLSIELEERIPIVYVELESAADTGTRQKLFMDPKGVLFPVMEAYHGNFLNVPVWYLQPGDVDKFREGAVIREEVRRPIVELLAASNLYGLTEIPAIREIFRPKDWKIIITLEGGTEVLMQVYDIRGQMERLAMILEHARSKGKTVRSVDVIPRMNPTVIYNN